MAKNPFDPTGRGRPSYDLMAESVFEEGAPDLDVTVEGSPLASVGAAPMIEEDADGVIWVDFEGGGPLASEPVGAFDENLAEKMDRSALAIIASKLIQQVEEDEESRQDWVDRFSKGLSRLGIVETIKGESPFPGASRVTHPLLAEAAVQFQARAIKELFPAGGPVKAKILGKKDREAEAARDRVTNYMNYQYTEEMPESFDELDQMLFYLPLSGSAFKKVYFDPSLGRTTVPFLKAEDVIVPYWVKSLARSPRTTHRMFKDRNDLLKLVKSGFYKHIDGLRADTSAAGLGLPANAVEETVQKAEGRTSTLVQNDSIYEILESHVEWDLPGYEDTDEFGEPTGVALPFIITVEKETNQVLAIRRNWRQDDPEKRKRVWFTHYKYLPGMGFYGFGLIHMIGGLSDSATGALRALMDAAQFANMQGGFRSKVAGSKGGEVAIKPGEWKETDMVGDDLKKHFFPIQYKEPSPTLFQLMGALVEAGQRFASTTEAMVGEADNKGPVGTTLAMIEQGSKIFSAIHKRCHRAQGHEFKLLKELNAEIIVRPYPYQVEGADREILPADFDRVDVVPVSDPNIFSATQRITQAQAMLQMAGAAPDIHDKYEAYRRMYDAMDIDPEGLLFDPNHVIPMDPITENQAMLYGKPIRAHLEELHSAHMQVHASWFQSLPPEGQQTLEQPFMAHMAEHLALEYRLKMQQVLGVPLPNPDLAGTGQVEMDESEQLSIDQQNQIAAAAASAINQYPQLNAPQGQQQPDPETMKAQAEVQSKQAEIARKDAAAQQKAQLDQAKVQADAQRADAKAQSDAMLAQQRTQSDIQRADAIAQDTARRDALRAEADRAALDAKTAAYIRMQRLEMENDDERDDKKLEADIEIAEKKQKADAEAQKKAAAAKPKPGDSK